MVYNRVSEEMELQKRLLFLVALVSLIALSLAHDMWLESESFIIKEPGSRVLIRNGNGTIYEKSENAVTTDRIARLVILDPNGNEVTPDPPVVTEPWLDIFFTPLSAGNYWVGLATRPNRIRLTGAEFTDYLEHDGIPAILRERQEKGISNREEVEQYSKYVKAFLKVGSKTAPIFNHPLGLTIEIVPLKNPYKLSSGDALPVQVLFQGEPLAGLSLHAGSDDRPQEVSSTVTDREGKASIRLSNPGRWYIRGIHLFQVDKNDHSYESYWATLTFQVE